jgi:hypothetical protein
MKILKLGNSPFLQVSSSIVLKTHKFVDGFTAPINYYRALMQLPKRLRPTKEPVKVILYEFRDLAVTFVFKKINE